ncbi:hypothetical protein Q7P36_003019 [Cladosporium allicinum]
MSRKESMSEASASLLSSNAEEDIYKPARRYGILSHTLFATLTVVNIVVLLATASIWLSFFERHDSIPRFAGAGDMLDAVRSNAIEYEVRTYSRPLEYDAVAQKAVILDHGSQKYIGPPSLEIDAAWTDLLRDRYVEMTPEEAKPFQPNLTTLSDTGRYFFESEVFHALHCVDSIRMHVSASMYGNKTTPRTLETQEHYQKMERIPPGIQELHMEHCVDRLREAKATFNSQAQSNRIQTDRPRPPPTTASRYTANMAPVFNSLLVLLSCVMLGYAHNIQLRAHSRECFHEMLHADDRMTVTFQVGDREFGGSGNLDLDFWIQNPSNAFEVYERSVSSGDHSFTAAHDGKFEYCFSNEHWSANSKEVSFNVHGIVYVPESEAPQDPLEKEVKQLAELLAQVKDEQGYIVVRERTHRNTAESTNARVKWWSIFQMGVVVGEGIFQVWWLKRFFEVKDPSRPSFNKGALG